MATPAVSSWISYEIGQEIRGDKVWFYIKARGTIVHEEVNNDAKEMDNLHHWSGSGEACDGCRIRTLGQR